MTKLRRLAVKHTPPCDSATRLISRARDGELTFAERLLLRAHLFGCRTCELFRRQLRLLGEAVRLRRLSHERGPRLPVGARERIKLALRPQGDRGRS